MNRKTAIAAAIAITMSLTSGIVALGANVGALGFGGTTAITATQQSATSKVGGAGSAVPKSGHEHDDRARATQVGVNTTAASAKGEFHD